MYTFTGKARYHCYAYIGVRMYMSEYQGEAAGECVLRKLCHNSDNIRDRNMKLRAGAGDRVLNDGWEVGAGNFI